MFPRWLDTLYGGLNWPALLLGIVKQARRPSRAGRLSVLVRRKVKRGDHPDLLPGTPSFSQVIAHLERHGIATFHYNYDGYYHYFSVRKSQSNWAKWLYCGDRLRSPQRTQRQGQTSAWRINTMKRQKRGRP